MNNYTKNYKKYVDITLRDFQNFDEVVTAVSEASLPKVDSPVGNVIVIMGFSGNGKSTFVKRFLKEYPEYKVLSVDEVSRTVKGKGSMTHYQKGGNNEFGENLIAEFGRRLDELTKSGEKIIIDGNFINLFTRMMLVDTLHEAGYNVNLVDITGQLGATIQARILDETSKELNEPITMANIQIISMSPTFIKVANRVLSFYEDEKRRGFFDAQKEAGVLDFGVDKYLTEKDSLAEMDSIKPRSN